VKANFDVEHLPAELGFPIPGWPAADAMKSYANDNFEAAFKLAAGVDAYLVLGNIVDADYELAVFDEGGNLIASGEYDGFGGAQWVWDATPTTKHH
jgi:hypothetical protein